MFGPSFPPLPACQFPQARHPGRSVTQPPHHLHLTFCWMLEQSAQKLSTDEARRPLDLAAACGVGASGCRRSESCARTRASGSARLPPPCHQGPRHPRPLQLTGDRARASPLGFGSPQRRESHTALATAMDDPDPAAVAAAPRQKATGLDRDSRIRRLRHRRPCRRKEQR